MENYRNKINNYIDELRNQKSFEHLDISITGMETKSTKDKITIESNAYLGIKSSLTANNMISDFIKDLFKDYKGDVNYLFKVTYTDLTNNKNQSNNTPADSEVVEQFITEKPKYKLSSMVLSEDKWNEVNRAVSSVKNSAKVYIIIKLCYLH